MAAALDELMEKLRSVEAEIEVELAKRREELRFRIENRKIVFENEVLRMIASLMVAGLAVFFQNTRIGRALRAVADSHKAALSVGVSLEQIWVVVWFAAGIVALATGIMWGARSNVSFALEIISLKALPVLILGGLTSIPGAIVGGIIIGVGEKLGEFYWGPLLGGGIESWLAYVIALGFPVVPAARPVRRTIIERVLTQGSTAKTGQYKTSYAADRRCSRSGRIARAGRSILLVAFVASSRSGRMSSFEDR